MRLFLFLSVIGISLMGCSTSIPLSEAYIFENDVVLNDSLRWKSSQGLAYSSNNRTSHIKEYVRDQSEESVTENDFWNLNKQGYGLLYAKNATSFSWGFSLGYRVFGANATFDLGRENFVTVNVAVSGGAELILQRKLFHIKEGNLAGSITFGLFGKRDYYARSGTGMFAGPNFDFIHLFGGRSMFHFAHRDNILHGFASYGYSPELEVGVLNVGISIGGSIFR